MAERLPDFVPPMLAKLGKAAFDSPDHVFEVKWDGTRALAFVEDGDYRLCNRKRHDQKARYPELEGLRRIEPGVVLDGEIVVFESGRPSFHAMLQREQARGEARARALGRTLPATYVVFDLLYRGFAPVMSRPLSERQELLREVVAGHEGERLVVSHAVLGNGRALFDTIVAQGLEGIVAKRLASPYLPGKRTDAWTKIKRGERLHCAIVGFLPEGRDDFKSLIVATNDPGGLRCVGRVGGGIDDETRARLNVELRRRLRPAPIVPCDEKGTWVEPGLYCTVTYVERTPDGNLRAPVFEELIVEA